MVHTNTDRSVDSEVLREWSYKGDGSTKAATKVSQVQDQQSTASTGGGIQLPVPTFVSNIAGQFKSHHETLVQQAYDIGTRLSSRGSAGSGASPITSPSRPVSTAQSEKKAYGSPIPMRVTRDTTNSPAFPMKSSTTQSDWGGDWNNADDVGEDVLGNGRFVEIFSQSSDSSSIADSAFSSNYSAYNADDNTDACFSQHTNNVQEVTTGIRKWWRKRRENREVKSRERLSSNEFGKLPGKRNRFKGKKNKKRIASISAQSSGSFTGPCPTKNARDSSWRRSRNEAKAPVQQYMDRTASNFSSSAIELMKQLSTSIHSKYSGPEEKRNPQDTLHTGGISEQYDGLENFFVTEEKHSIAWHQNEVLNAPVDVQSESAKFDIVKSSMPNYPASDITFEGGFEDRRNTSLETELPDSCKKPNRIDITFPQSNSLRTSPSGEEDVTVDHSVRYKVNQIERRIEASNSNDMVEEIHPKFLFSSMKCGDEDMSQSNNACNPHLRKSVTEEHINESMKIVFVGSPESGKTSIINALLDSSALCKNERKTISSRGSKAGDSRRSLRRKESSLRRNRNKIDVNIKTWKPTSSDFEPTCDTQPSVEYQLWDLQGGTLDSGSHYATQTLFFSEYTVYIIVWDMSANNALSMRRGTKINTSGKLSRDQHELRERYSSDEYDDQYNDEEDEMYVEGINRKADRELERDIDENVLYWADIISNNLPNNSAIMPVVSFQDVFDLEEVRRRCRVLQNKLSSLQSSINILYNESNEVVTVSSTNDGGIDLLKRAIIYNTISSRKFDGHIGMSLSPITHSIQSIISFFKEKKYKVLHLDDIIIKLAENPPPVESFSLRKNLVVDALRILSAIGSVLYFGWSDSLSEYIILDPTWIGNVVSCIFQKDIKRELLEMNGDYIPRSKSVISSHHNCAIISQGETNYIWKNMDFIGQAIEKLNASSVESEKLFSFFTSLCEHHGIFVPFDQDDANEKHYFTPSLCNDVPEDIWSFKSKDINWKATLCQSWVIQKRVPPGLIEKVLSRTMKSFSRDEMRFSSSKVHQMICWKTAFYAKVEYDRSMVEFFVRLIRSTSPYCVASCPDTGGNWKVIVSAKGVIGCDGEVIWNAGYRQILKVVEETMKTSDCHYKREVICPDCLATSNPGDVVAWPMNDDNTGDYCIPAVCDHGHRVNSRLLFGEGDDDTVTSGSTTISASTYSSFTTASTLTTPRHNANDIVQSVVLVGLWNAKQNRIVRVGSGFIADRRRGLIITASHIFFKMEIDQEVESYWHQYDTKAVIGVISPESNEAAFTYCADIIYEDVCNVDACVLRVTARFEEPIYLDSTELAPQSEMSIRKRRNALSEPRLQLNEMVQLEDHVRIIGFNQMGEGVLREGEHLNRTVDLTDGYVARNVKRTSGRHITLREFVPNSEIIVMCVTYRGHSGGPCVDQNGKVIGLVSRADTDESKRCYLVPASELKRLLKEAKKRCDTKNRFSP